MLPVQYINGEYVIQKLKGLLPIMDSALIAI